MQSLKGGRKKSMTDKTFLKQSGIVSDTDSTPSTWELWQGDGGELRRSLVELEQIAKQHIQRCFRLEQQLNMWKLATALLAGVLVLLIVFGKVR